DRRQLPERARPTAVRSAHDDGAASAWLRERHLFLAADCQSGGGADGLHDDRGGGAGRISGQFGGPPRAPFGAGLAVCEVLKLAEKAGLVKLGHVALDGTKIKANASKHKAMSY